MRCFVVAFVGVGERISGSFQDPTLPHADAVSLRVLYRAVGADNAAAGLVGRRRLLPPRRDPGRGRCRFRCLRFCRVCR